MKKFARKFFKFSVIFFFIAVFAFSNFVSFLPQVLQNNKLAENLKIKEALAVVANDAASESHTGTTGNTSAASFTWTHTPVGTPRGVLVFVYTISATKKVTSVTYGGVAMTEVAGGAAADTANEPGRVDTFFLGTGILTGTQSIIVNRINDATIMYASAATQTAGTNTEIYVPGIVLLQENGTFVEQLVDDGSPGTNSQRYAAAYSGGANILSAGVASTVLNNIDFGVYTITTAKETTAGQSARNVGFTDATADDRAAVHLAVREIPPPTTLAISQTAGSKIANLDSGGVNQYVHDTSCTSAATCAAFTLTASGGAVNMTSIKITESGTVTANTELSNINLYYDTDGNWFDVGTETLFGTAANFAADQTATINGALTIFAGQTAYIYVRYDLVNGGVYPTGGATVNFQIANVVDVISDAVESGTGILAGIQTIRPNVTSFSNSTEPALTDGARETQTISISGAGFGTTCSASSKVSIGAYDLSCTGATFNNTTITILVDAAIPDANNGGAGASGLLATIGNTADDARQTFYVYPDITDVTNPTAYINAAREYNAADTDGMVTINGNHFGSSQGTSSITVLGQTATINSWSDTVIQIQVPTTIADNSYTGDIIVYQGAGGNSATSDSFGGGIYRILPRIISLNPSSQAIGSAIEVIGNHLCQNNGVCPSIFGINNKATFFNNIDATILNSWVNGDSSTVGVNVGVPTGVATGNLFIKSNAYDSNSAVFSILSTIPNDPDVSGSRQYKLDGATVISFGGITNESTIILKADISSSLNIDMALQVEVKPVGTVFDEVGIIEGTVVDGGACTNCTGLINAKVSVSGLSDSTKHWRARVKNTTTNEFSNWAYYGTSNINEVDFEVDVTFPVISAVQTTNIQANSITITWNTNEISTSQVQYNKTGTFVNNCATNNDCTVLDSNYVSGHTVNLSNLDSGTTYYYRVRSKDVAGNEAISINYNFLTLSVVNQPAKTVNYYALGVAGVINSAATASTTFSVIIPEASISIISAFVELSAISLASGINNFQIQVNSQAVKTYTIDSGESFFKIFYKIDSANLNIDPQNNIIYLTPSLATYIASAKIIITYAYTP